jgi:hypothetical protein
MDQKHTGIGSQQLDRQYAGPTEAGVYSGTLAGAKTPQPVISSLYEAIKHMREAADQVRSMADRLCGSQPESVGSEASPQSMSLFGQIEDVAGEIRAMAARVSIDMQRVQNRL